VNWYEAYAFCIWDGGFLPSEAEWEYAAAGGSEQRNYPWGPVDPGTAPPNEYAIYGDSVGNCYYPNGLESCTGPSNFAPVGSATGGAGKWGQFDLVGEVWEWQLDWEDAYVHPCADCAGLSELPSSSRVIRGGAFNYAAARLVPWSVNGSVPTSRYNGIGFRCARIP